MKDKALRKYLIWAFIPAWILQAIASRLALKGQQLGFTAVLMLSMLVPTLAVLLAKIPLRGMGWQPVFKGHWKWFFAAWLGPAALGILGAALYFLIFPAHFDLSGSAYLASLPEEARQQLDAAGMPMSVLMLISAAASLTYAPFINMFPGLGEEIGWRGALYPRLKAHFGKSKGRLLGGLIWGAWHWPVMILAGYEYGLAYWGAPVLGPPLFCLITVGLGTLLDLLYEKTGSIWFPALGHGAINAFAVPSMLVSSAYDGRLSVLGPLMVGVIGGLPMLLLAAAVLLRGKDAPAAPDGPAA